MEECKVCGNEYDQLMEIKINGDDSGWYDCFECAIHDLAPSCRNCGVKIVGHGVEAEDQLFCGAHCARSRGYDDIIDHSEMIISQ